MLAMGTFASESIWTSLAGTGDQSRGTLKLVYPTLEVRQSTQAI